ncbi:MAG: CAP domain-containing protein [Planctomycetes bacterium]|nr:CAP domain-containing protein [Planctomycetota bacterium]
MFKNILLLLPVFVFFCFSIMLSADEPDKTAALQGKIKSLCKESKFEEALKEYGNLSADTAVPDKAKADSADYIIGVINHKKKSEIKKVKAKIDETSRLQMKSMKEELNKRREAALEIIFDDSVYPEGDSGKAAQPKVNEKVDAVREIWDNFAVKASDLPANVSSSLEYIRALDGYLATLGETVKPEEEAGSLLLGAGRDEFRNFSLNNTEKELIEYNRKIHEANENCVTVMSRDEMDIFKKTNEYREMLGLKILGANDSLAKAAKKHTEWCVKRGKIDHIQDITASRTPQDRAGQEGYKKEVGENLHQRTAVGDVVQAVFNGWYNSPAHHKTMLRDWNESGISQIVSGDAFSTQMFGTAEPAVLKYSKKNKKNSKK